jgi:NAD-dependent deacetylase
MFDVQMLNALKQARHIVVLTGAGISAESGIPTFRDAQTGLWEHFDPATLASPDGYKADKALVWGWYEWRRMAVLKAKPNLGHYAIRDLAKRVETLTLITQNVDDLHERAGSQNVIHLHGSLHQPRCFHCARPYQFPGGIPDEPAGGRRLEPPSCRHCGSGIRPGVVWFGETVPESTWKNAESATRDCDILLSIGTSSLVWPAAQLPLIAVQQGSKVIQINPGETALDKVAHFLLRGKAGNLLPLMLQAIEPEGTINQN